MTQTVPAVMTDEGVTAAQLALKADASSVTSALALKADSSTVSSLSSSVTTLQTQKLTQGAAVASTSGTSIDFTSIPSWVRRITVMLYGVSTSGTARLLIQVGASGSVVTTGYQSYTSDAGSTSTAGMILGGAQAADVRYGAITFVQQDTNKWIATSVTNSSTSSGYNNIGNITLAATLDRVRVTTTNGTDTFDAGSINILYE